MPRIQEKDFLEWIQPILENRKLLSKEEIKPFILNKASEISKVVFKNALSQTVAGTTHFVSDEQMEEILLGKYPKEKNLLNHIHDALFDLFSCEEIEPRSMLEEINAEIGWFLQEF